MLEKDFGRAKVHLPICSTVPVGSGWSHVPCGKKLGGQGAAGEVL